MALRVLPDAGVGQEGWVPLKGAAYSRAHCLRGKKKRNTR